MEEKTKNLLSRWQTNAKRSQIANYDAANYNSSLNYKLGIPAIIFAAIVGTSVFATLQSKVEIWAQILVGILSVFAAVLTSLQTFLKSEEKAAKHRTAAVEYGTIKRQIDELLLGGKISDDLLQDQIRRIRERLDDLSRDVPIVPRKIWTKATETIPLSKTTEKL